MQIIKKYLMYKRALQGFFAVNVFFIMFGIVALIEYFKTHEQSVLTLTAVGAGTFVFGIYLPIYLMAQLGKVIKEIKTQTEHMVAQWVSGWFENYNQYEEDAIKDPRFWLNMVLLTTEIFGDHSKHPAARLIGEFAPILRQEIQKQTHKKTKVKRAA
ncbi:MAG: hypothetical protein SGI74_11205 [Oligoflexia bacterium]|nr:hypothetical protein [Oligoflexia bacterium]